MQNSKRSQTSQKVSKNERARTFNLQNVTINEDTKQPFYLTPHSYNGMRKLTRQQREIYEAHIKTKQSKQCQKNDEDILKNKLAQQKQKDRYNRAQNNYYITAQKHQQKKDQKLKIFQMLNYNPHLQKKSKHSTRIQNQLIKQKQQKRQVQQVKLQKTQSQMIQSTLNLVKQYNQQQKQKSNMGSIREIQKGYFDEKFNNFDNKQDKTLQIVELIYNKLGMSQPSQQKTSQIQQKLKKQLGQALMINSKLVKQIKQKEQLVRQRQNELKQLKYRYRGLQRSFQQVNLQKQDSAKIQELKFYSNLTIQNNISLFIKQIIEQISNKQIKTAKMLFQKDAFNTNIGNYIDCPPFPVVMLFTTVNKTIFGVFSEGIWTTKSNYKHQDNTFKTILFNASTKTKIENYSQTSIKCGLNYSDNYLIFGNHQLTLKNRDLNLMKVYGNTRFGERYFNLGRRQILTGEVKDEIQIVEMQIFSVVFNNI